MFLVLLNPWLSLDYALSYYLSNVERKLTVLFNSFLKVKFLIVLKLFSMGLYAVNISLRFFYGEISIAELNPAEFFFLKTKLLLVEEKYFYI